MQCICILKNVSLGRHRVCCSPPVKSTQIWIMQAVSQDSYKALQDMLDHLQGSLLCVVNFYSYCNLTCLIHSK